MIELHHSIPKQLGKQFYNALVEKEIRSNETREEKYKRLSQRLGIEKHGKGKRKKKNKKKGGK